VLFLLFALPVKFLNHLEFYLSVLLLLFQRMLNLALLLLKNCLTMHKFRLKCIFSLFLQLLFILFCLTDDCFSKKFLLFYAVLPFIFWFLSELLVVFDLFFNLLHSFLIFHELCLPINLFLFAGLSYFIIVVSFEFKCLHLPFFFYSVVLFFNNVDLVIDLILLLLVSLLHGYIYFMFALLHLIYSNDGSLMVFLLFPFLVFF